MPTPPLSILIVDRFVRRAFELAEREDGTAPAVTVRELRKPLLGDSEVDGDECPYDPPRTLGPLAPVASVRARSRYEIQKAMLLAARAPFVFAT
jgi:hypothetical protein